MREILPGARRVAALADPANAFTKSFFAQIHASAKAAGLEIQDVMIGGTQDLEPIFAGMASGGVDALVVQPTLPRAPIIALARKHRLATVSGNRAFADAGGLMSYAGSPRRQIPKCGARTWTKFLKGAKPADLPVQQPTKFELVINLKTAKALGIAVPHAMLTRADEVIE